MIVQVIAATASQGSGYAPIGGFLAIAVGRVLWRHTYWGRRGAENRARTRATREDQSAQHQAGATGWDDAQRRQRL